MYRNKITFKLIKIYFNKIQRCFFNFYVNCETVLSENKLPTKADFFEVLRGEGISQEDYESAQAIWNSFKCKTLVDY